MTVKFLLLLITGNIIYAPETASAQYVMNKTVVNGNSIIPGIHHATDKKLIQTSSTLQWNFVKNNIAFMESRHPYLDGVASSMNGNFSKDYRMLSGDKLWTEEDVQLSTVSQIKWGKFTDNFVVLYFGDSLDLDFFNEKKWSVIFHNAAMVSKMVKAGRFKGLFLDDENYFNGSHGWQYDTSWYQGYSFEQVSTKCRERGKKFMESLQLNVTNALTILDFIWFGDHWNNYDVKNGRQGLWLAFKNGMLEAARAGDILVEGNELSYYYQETTMFTDIYNEFRLHKFTKYGTNNLQHNYKTQVQIGHGIYPSLYYGKFRWAHQYNDKEQDTWWANQLYNSLMTSDKYVWIWTEPGENWWGESGEVLFAPNFTSVMKKVKAKIKNQQSLNYDLVRYENNWAGNLVNADDPKPGKKWHIAISPTVSITSPTNKSVTKSSVIINTRASVKVSKVEFYINSMLVGVDSIAPYSVKVSNLANGKYTLFARAFDNQKEHTTSAPVIISVDNK
jgi:hypothetical protein